MREDMENRTAFIMRGVPGSGKSTVAKQIAKSFPGQSNLDGTEWLPDHVIHSTDDLCMVDGEYRFDRELAQERHERNLANFRHSLEMGFPCVICDNTNFQRRFYQPYENAAREAGYKVVFVEMPHPVAKVAAARNTHGVPLGVIQHMLDSWEPITGKSGKVVCEIVHIMGEQARRGVALGFVGGTVFGALCVASLWLFT